MQLLLQCRLTFPQVIQKHEVKLLRVNKTKHKLGCCTLFVLKLVQAFLHSTTVMIVSDVLPCLQFWTPRLINSFIFKNLLSVHYKNQILGDDLELFWIFHPSNTELLHLLHSPSCNLASASLFQPHQSFHTIFSSLCKPPVSLVLRTLYFCIQI